jgi:hypothetical protein
MQEPYTSLVSLPSARPRSDALSDGLVFLRGTGRCGTKSLINQLGRHPDLGQVPVNEVLPEELIDWTETRIRPLARPGVLDEAAIQTFCTTGPRPG